MSGKSTPTIRSVAKMLQLSTATVSDALRGTGRVSDETRERVRAAAREIGYKVNPLTTTLMSGLRRSRATKLKGVIASVEISEPGYEHGPFPGQILLGARQRATELGFKFEEFVAGPEAISLPRLDSILKSRGIHGIMLLPTWAPPDVTALDWSRYAGVYADTIIEKPRLHTVSPDHYRSMIELLTRLYERGYRRPGLMLKKGRDERILLRQSAAFRAFQESHENIKNVPILAVDKFAQKDFTDWFRRFKPDVVLTHHTETMNWMETCGAIIPATHGFVCLNVLNRARPCAALDLQPRQIGARAAELLIGQLQRGEFGSPPWQTTTMLTAAWIEGPSCRGATIVPA